MDAQDFRSLQEAYMEVVMNEIDEGYKELPVDKMVAKSKSLSRKPKPPGSPRWGPNDEAASRIRKIAGTHSRAKVKKVEKANRERGTKREEYDLYDIILSHLLDEGYAETIESAEAIMVNMSEEWREDIISEAQIMSVSGPGGLKHMINPNVLKLQNAASRERQERKTKENSKKETQNVARLDAANKRGIKAATNRSNDGEGGDRFVQGSSLRARERDDVPTDYRARRRRASGR